MRKNLSIILGCVFLLVFGLCAPSFGQDDPVVIDEEKGQQADAVPQAEGQPITQEEFAVELVKAMRMDGWLPLSALPQDCVDLLDKAGISPLVGWKNKSLLTKEDYLVILSKAHGDEQTLHERAFAVEQKNIEVINAQWQAVYQKTNRWISLEELLNDPQLFPQGAPQSPYGIKYQDTNKDHKVDLPFLPVISLMRLRAALSE